MIKRIWAFVRTNPGDAVTGLVVLVIAGLTVADLTDKLTLSQEVLARVAVFVFCALFILVLVERQAARHREETRDANRAAMASNLRDIDRNLALLRKGQITEVPADDIGARLTELLDSASGWYFRGGSGRWQRSNVLPALARLTDRDVPYVMQILNPTDPELCVRYASYRARQRPPEVRRQGEDQPETVRDDILACIYAAAWYRFRTRLQTEVYLQPLYSPLRLDIGTSGLMATVADPKAPGLLGKPDGWYYQSVLDEIKQACTELPRLVLCADPAALPDDPAQVDGSRVEKALATTVIVHPAGHSDPLLKGWLQQLDFGHIGKLAFAGVGE